MSSLSGESGSPAKLEEESTFHRASEFTVISQQYSQVPAVFVSFCLQCSQVFVRNIHVYLASVFECICDYSDVDDNDDNDDGTS